MPTPRKQQISLSDTNYYHCVSRCTRRAFLFGVYQFTGQNYNHRRDWVVDRINLLGQVFAIDAAAVAVAAFSVMSNHYHVVLRVDTEKADNWSLDEVVQQWHKIYHGTYISQQYIAEGKLPLAQSLILQENVETWRRRLCDILSLGPPRYESLKRAYRSHGKRRRQLYWPFL